MENLSEAARRFLRNKWPKTHRLINSVYDNGLTIDIRIFGMTYGFILHGYTQIYCDAMDYLEANWQKICQRGATLNIDTTAAHPYVSALFEVSENIIFIGANIYVFRCAEIRLESKLRRDIEALKIITATLPQPIAEEIAEYI